MSDRSQHFATRPSFDSIEPDRIQKAIMRLHSGRLQSWPRRLCNRQWDEPCSFVSLGNVLSRWILLGSSSLLMGPCMNPFSTSFRVASKRLESKSLSPKLCTDSSRTSRPRSDALLKSWQDMLAGLNFWENTPDLGKAPVRSKPFFKASTQGQVLMSRFTNECVKKTESLVFQNFFYSSAKGPFEFSLLFCQPCCKDGPLPDLFCALFGDLMNDLAGQVRKVCPDFFGKQGLLLGWMLKAKGFLRKPFWRKMDSYRDVILWRTRDIPPFGSAELTRVGRQLWRVCLMDQLLKLWN